MDLLNITINYVAVRGKDYLFSWQRVKSCRRWLLWVFRGVIFHVHMHLQTEQQGNMNIQSKATNVYIIVQGNKWLNLIFGK